METLIESPRVAFVSGSSLPASPQFSLHRLILPVLCVAIGISVGSATGLTLALVNASEYPVAASSSPLQSPAVPKPRVTQNASPAQADSPVASPTTAANASDATPSSDSRHAFLSPVAKRIARTPVIPSKVEIASNKTPDALRPATFNLDGKTYHAAKMTFVPAPQPDEQAQPATEAATPTTLNTAQWGLDAPESASLYTEGVLTVSDYSPTSRTIQTSDGKTFALGTTVAAGNATSWESYRADVHYRCDQNGSCVLMRAGVVVPDARLI